MAAQAEKEAGPRGGGGRAGATAVLASLCHSGGVCGGLINRWSLFLQCKVCSLSANKVQCYSSAGNTESIYMMLLGKTPSGDVPEEYGFGQQFLQVLPHYLSLH